MPTPLMQDRGSASALVSSGAAVGSGYYSLSGTNPAVVTNSSNYLVADFRLYAAAGTTASKGSIQLVKVPYSLVSSVQGPVTSGSGTFAAGVVPQVVGVFNQNYSTTAAWLSLMGGPVALDPKADYYIYNTTDQSVAAGWSLEWCPWSAGT